MIEGLHSPAIPLWRAIFGLDSAPAWWVATLGLACTYWLVIIPSAAAISYFDRKLGADFQARVGPNRAGPSGALQPFADFLKLLQKRALKSHGWRESLWFGIHTMALYSTVAVLPLGSLALFVDTDMSAFIPFWAALVLAMGTMLLGLSQETVPGWFGGVRVAAQAVTGALPALVSLICVGVKAGGFRWSAIAGSQGFSPFSWTIFSDPFQCLAAVIFLVSGLVLLSIPPMDAGLSMADLHGGVGSHLFGRRLVLFRLGRFYGFFLWAEIAVVLFLGGWALPSGLTEALRENEALWLLQLLELIWVLLKTYLLMLLVIWVARVNPRSRVDQVTDFAWKVLSPFSLFALIGTALWSAWRAL